MKALIVDGRHGLRVEETPAPSPGPGQVRIRAACSLISPGTELHYIDRCAATGERLRLGYCSSGWVEEVGEAAGSLAVGDRVIAMGWGYATHAEVVCVPFRLCVRVPQGLSFDRAVFACIAATALHAVHRGTLHPEDDVLVVGAGLVGRLVAQCAAARAARVYLTDKARERLDRAESARVRALMAPEGRSLVDAVEATAGKGRISKVFLCITGDATQAMADVIALLAASKELDREIAVICVGRFDARVAFSVEMGNLDIRYAARCGAGYRDEAYVHGQQARTPLPGQATVDDNLAACLRLIDDGTLDVSAIPTARVRFDDAPRAYDLLRSSREIVTATLHHPGFTA